MSVTARAVVPEVTITASEIVMNVTPGGTITHTIYGRRSGATLTGCFILTDSDGDGIIRRPHPANYTQFSVLIGDITSGRSAFGSLGVTANPQSLPPATVLRGTTGEYTWIVLPAGTSQIVWMRAGVGAWSGNTFNLIPSNGLQMVETSTFQPMINGTAVPTGFALGDTLAVLKTFDPITGLVDGDLNAPPSGGEVSLVTSGFLSVRESESSFVTLLRTGGSSGPVSVRVDQTAGTAVAGVHFELTNPVTFAAGELLKRIPLRLIDDQVYGGLMTFTLGLTTAVGTRIGSGTPLTGHIQDNDPAPRVTFENLPDTVQERNDPWILPVALRKSGETRLPATVNYRWTFSRGNVTGSGQVTFAPSEQQKTIDVPIPGNTVPDPDAGIQIDLLSAVDAQIQGNRAWITVLDDDPAELSAQDASVSEAGGYVQVQVSIEPYFGQSVSLTWSTADGTAKAGTDYVSQSQTISNSSHFELLIPILPDEQVEPAETFFVDISAVEGNVVVKRSRATVTITDDARPRVTIENVSVLEGGPGERTDVQVRVTLSGPALTPSRCQIGQAFPGGTARPEVDYVPWGTEWVNFAPGQSSASFVIRVLGDADVEGNEFIPLTAYSLEGLKAPSLPGMLTIIDDDLPPAGRLRVGDLRVVEGTGTSNSGRFEIYLANAVDNLVRVSYSTVGGTAVAGEDFTSESGTIVLTPGQTSAQVTVNINADSRIEANETFELQIYDPAGALIDDASGTGTIVDDDAGQAEPTLSADDIVVRENAGTAVITLVLSAPSIQPVRVAFQTVAGTAGASSDFVPAQSFVTFTPGELSKSIAIPIVDDRIGEAEEKFEVRLSIESASPASLTAACTIRDDDSGRKRAVRH